MAFLFIFLAILALFIYIYGFPIGRETGGTYQFLPFLNYDLKGLVAEGPWIRIGPNPDINCLATVLLLIKVMGVLFKIGKVVWYCSPCCRKGRTSKGFAGTLGRALKKPVSGWQGMWANFGKLVGRVTPPISWEFTPEQVLDPDEMARRLAEGCFSYEDPNMQFFALYWGLASAYRAAVDYSRNAMAKAETQTMPPGTSATSTTSTGSGTETTPPKIPLAPVVKRKSWISVPDMVSLRPMGDQNRSNDSRRGPDTDTSASSQQQQSSLKMESEVSRSLTPSELRDLRKDYSCQPGERILSWLLRCRDGGARAHLLTGHEAQHLGSLTKNCELDQLIADPKPETSLWARLVTAVKEKYAFKDYLTCPVRKWTKAEEAIQYLRELALLELMYDDSEYDGVADEPEGVSCTMPMWRKIVQGAPASCAHVLAATFLPNTQETLVGTLCTVLRHIEETVESRNAFSRENGYTQKPEREESYDHYEYEDDYGDYKDQRYRDRSAERSRPQSRSRSRSRSRSPSITRRRRESPRRNSRNELWAYLRAQGENMKKWDGEATSKLAARVRELKSKEARKKVIYVVDADERGRQSPRRRKTEVRFRDDKKASDKPHQRSDGECSNQNQ